MTPRRAIGTWKLTREQLACRSFIAGSVASISFNYVMDFEVRLASWWIFTAVVIGAFIYWNRLLTRETTPDPQKD